jgi:hypothetical protein
MSHRTAAWLAWSLCAVCVVLIALGLLLDFTTEELPLDVGGFRYDPGFAVLTGGLSLAYPAVGALIASRLPTNPIGWIFCGMGVIYVTQRFAIAYADHALLETLALPWGEFAAWFSTWIGFAFPTLGVFLMLLFPGGRLPSRRWRIVVWLTVFGAAMSALGEAFMPGILLHHTYVENPFEIVGVIYGKLTTYGFFGVSRLLGMTLLSTSLLAALISVILRLRDARGNDRQQLKWFLLAAVPLTVLGSLDGINNIVADFTTDFMFHPVYILYSLGLLVPVVYVEVLAFLLIPVCAYIAILRYNLYDIDVVVNRTLVYGSLSVMLVALYFGGVVVLQRVFVFLTGQRSTLAVVASTLLIAALFTPLRRRIQFFIDRRFYRRKYDARKTLEAFSATLRKETDLEALREDLVVVVRETMQPEHVSLWLRPDTPRNGQRVGWRLLISVSAWKDHFANFAMTEFSDILM